MNYFKGLIFYLTVLIQFCNCINLNILNGDLEICSTDPLTGFKKKRYIITLKNKKFN